MPSPLLVAHICGGTAGLLSGFAAMSLPKGSRGHGRAGNLFVVSMLVLGSTAVYLGLLKAQTGNVVGGAMTCYLVTTAWSTARQREPKPGTLDWIGLLFALVVAALNLRSGVERALSAKQNPAGAPAVAYFLVALIALLCAAGDLRMIVRGGLLGRARLVRHLWRMCFAWFVASGSIFLARPHLFPVFMSKTHMLAALGLLPLLLMIFWLVRVRVAKAWGRKPVQPAAPTSATQLAAIPGR
jgi:hypothetical protein